MSPHADHLPTLLLLDPAKRVRESPQMRLPPEEGDEVTACENCGEPVKQNEYGTWKHEHLDLTYCHTLHAETLYNNWDNRVAAPLEETK